MDTEQIALMKPEPQVALKMAFVTLRLLVNSLEIQAIRQKGELKHNVGTKSDPSSDSQSLAHNHQTVDRAMTSSEGRCNECHRIPNQHRRLRSHLNRIAESRCLKGDIPTQHGLRDDATNFQRSRILDPPQSAQRAPKVQPLDRTF